MGDSQRLAGPRSVELFHPRDDGRGRKCPTVRGFRELSCRARNPPWLELTEGVQASSVADRRRPELARQSGIIVIDVGHNYPVCIERSRCDGQRCSKRLHDPDDSRLAVAD